MNKYIKNILVAGSLLLGATACDFGDMNVNPNDTTQVSPAFLLTSAQRSLISSFMGTSALSEYGTHYTQQLQAGTYADVSNYSSTQSSFYSYYTGGMNDLEQIVKYNMDEATQEWAEAQAGKSANQIAVAKILQAWAFQNITDVWGAVPYSQSLMRSESEDERIRPKYDSQEEIYAALVSSLEEAVAMIDEGASVDGDVIYGGNMAMWKKFGNAMILRVTMRTSDVLGDANKAAFAAAAAGAFGANADNAAFVHLTDAANDNDFYSHFFVSKRQDYFISATLLDKMEADNDPRVPIYASPANEPAAEETDPYVGMPHGQASGEAVLKRASIPGAMFIEATQPSYMMTYAEVEFLKAEAVERGWITGSAAAHYEAAIRASMENVGVAAADIDTFVANEAAYDASNWKKSIGEQKWVALYLQGVEAWSEWRRLDYPMLTPSQNAVEGRSIPLRREYAQNEYDLNADNLGEALQAEGLDPQSPSDYYNKPLWWDVN